MTLGCSSYWQGPGSPGLLSFMGHDARIGIMYSHFVQKDFPDTVVDFDAAADLKNTPPIIAGNNNSVMVGNGSTRRVTPASGYSPVELRRNLVANPRGITPDTTVRERRRNYVANPHAVSAGTGWTNQTPAGGTTSYVPNGASDGGSAFQAVTVASGEVRLSTPVVTGLQVANTDVLTVAMEINAPLDTTGVFELHLSAAQAGSTSMFPKVASFAVKTGANRYVAQFTGLTGYVRAFQFISAASATPGTWKASRATVEKAVTLGDYFDGANPDTKTIDYAWTGTPNASASVANSAYIEVRRNYLQRVDGVNYFTALAGTMTNAVSYAGKTWQRHSATASGQIARVFSPIGALTSGQPYSFGVLLGNDGTSAVTYNIDFSDVTPGLAVTLQPGEQRRVTLLNQVRATGHDSIFRFVDIGSTAADTSILIAEPILELGATVGDFFDGNTADTAPYVYEWTGTPNTSPSVQRSRLAAGLTTVQGGANETYQTDFGVAVKPISSTNNNTWVGISGDLRPLSSWGWKPGETYTVLAKIRVPPGASSTGYSALRKIVVMKQNWTNIAVSDAAPVTPGDYDLRLTFTIPADATVIGIRLYNGNTTSGATVEFSDLAIVRGVYDGPFFHGNTLDENGRTYSWVGAANNSESIESAVGTPMFMAGSEANSFSVESWMAPLSDVNVYAVNSPNVSLGWVGEKISFSVKVNGTDVTLDHRPPVRKACHVVGAYSAIGMSLYVDGLMVGSTNFDERNTAGWASDQETVVIGSGTGRAVVDGVAFYTKELKSQTALEHYQLGRTTPPITTNLSGLSATILNFENQDKFLTTRAEWPDWDSGLMANVEIVDGDLYSESGGTWNGFIPMPNYDIIQKAKVSWVGTATISVSIDGGATWQNIASNPGFIPGISGASPMTVDIRATFVAGATLESLIVELYGSLQYEINSTGATATYGTGNVVNAADTYNQLEYREDRGFYTNGAGGIVVAHDPAVETEPIYAIDAWVKLDSITQGTIFSVAGGSGSNVGPGAVSAADTLYINGQPASSATFVAGEWTHVLMRLAAPRVGDVSIATGGLVGSIGSVTIFKEDVTGQEQRIYRSYFGGQRLDLSDDAGLVIAEGGWDLYSYDWTTTGS